LPAPSLEAAARRIRYLEEALTNERDLLCAVKKSLHELYASSLWRLLFWIDSRRLLLFPPRTMRGRLVRLLGRCTATSYRTVAQLWRWRRFMQRSVNEGYHRWIAAHEPNRRELARQRKEHAAAALRFSLLVPCASASMKEMQVLVESVREQTYAGWELLLAAGPEGKLDLEQLSGGTKDARIRRLSSPTEAATLAACGGEFLAVLTPQDSLAPFALFEAAQALDRNPDADLLYSDEDVLDRGARRDPHFKPDWSPEALRGHNYIGRLALLRRELAMQIGGLGEAFTEAGHYDLVLRASEQARRIVHVSKILYHRRPTAPREDAAASRKALSSHVARQGISGDVLDGPHPGTYRVRYAGPRPSPLVSIIIPTREHPKLLSECVASIRAAIYSNVEILIVENGSKQSETFECYRRLCKESDTRVLRWEAPFNYSSVNNFAAAQAQGSLLLFLNDDVQGIHPDWIDSLVEQAVRPEVGAVGAKLLYDDDTIQHAGVVLGVDNGPGHYQRLFPGNTAGYGNRLAVVQELTAVTGACLMTRKELFDEIGGFDEAFVIAFNDIDLCLRLGQKSYKILWTPYAELYHHEYATRGPTNTPEKEARESIELLMFRLRWREALERGDPYYNPNLTRKRLDCSLDA
jgi:GT2 family glycosyltransferase